MKYILTLCFLFAYSVAYAGQGMGPGPGVKAYSSGESYTDIIFWWRAEAESISTGDYAATPPNFTSNLDDGSGYTATAKKVGTNGLDLRGWDELSWTIQGVKNFRYGFWWQPKNRINAGIPFELTNGTDSVMVIWRDTDELELNINDAVTAQSTNLNIALNTWYFVEIMVDDTNNTAKLYIDSLEVVSISSAFAIANDLVTVIHGDNNSSTEGPQYLDNVMLSTDPTRNLYLLRNDTASPR